MPDQQGPDMPGRIETHRSAINNALRLLVFAFRVYEACTRDKPLLTPDFCFRQIDVQMGGKFKIVPERVLQRDLEIWSYNLLLSAVGESAMVINEALDKELGAKDPTDASTAGSIRAIIYQMRNAFAHGPFEPKWCLKDKYKRVYRASLQGGHVIEFDGRALDEKNVRTGDFGGFDGYLRMIHHCLEHLVPEE